MEARTARRFFERLKANFVMTSISPKPIPLDDSELLRVAAAPRARLFQILTRVTAFAPLIVVCCVLPAFQLLTNPTLNEEGSLWGLRSLAVAKAKTIEAVIKPGLNESGEPLMFQAPLAPWLNGVVIRMVGPTSLISSSLVSIVATGISIWLMTRLAWRIGGANTALVSALLMCSHPQVLEMAIEPTNGAIGMCLMLTSVFGFQRHLEGRAVRISTSLMISGIVWGLSVLAIGPVAFSVPILFALHAMNQRTGPQPEFASTSFRRQMLQSRTVLRSTLFLFGVGSLVSCWWGFVMLPSYGMTFLRSWWSSLPVELLSQPEHPWRSDLQSLLQPSWRDWLFQQALILGWLIVGLERSWHAWRRPISELARRRYQLLMLWWSIAFLGRVFAEVTGFMSVSNTFVWNVALLGPTVLLSAVGIGTLIERDVSRRGEFCLVVLLVSLTVARIGMSWWMGLAGSGLAAAFLLFWPLFAPSANRASIGWTEEGWRKLLRSTVYGSLIACLAVGLSLRNTATDDGTRLADLRDRLKTFPEVRRISLIATRDPVPITLRHLLRCRWPDAELVTSEGWDAGLTQAMNEESKDPHSRFLILEWTRRDVRLSADTGQAWQISSLGDPMRFHGRRLSMVLIEPRS